MIKITELHRNIINGLVLWIEHNMESALSLDVIAEKSGYSKWHLQRLFKSCTGHVLGQYIRMRRLSCAAIALRVTTSSILDISVKYRFDSQQTFCRAFKLQFGMTPSAYRRNAGWSAGNFCFPIHNGVEIKTRSELVTLPAIPIIGLDHNYQKNTTLQYHEQPKFRREFWKTFLSDVHEVPAEFYALHRPAECSVDDIIYTYTTAFTQETAPGMLKNRAALMQQEIPAGNYLKMSVRPQDLLPHATAYSDITHAAYTRILPEMNVLRRRGPDIEHYKLSPVSNYDDFIDNVRDYIRELDYYIPVIL